MQDSEGAQGASMQAQPEMNDRARATQSVESWRAAFHEPTPHRQSMGFARRAVIACLAGLMSTSAVAKSTDLGFEDAFPTKIHQKSWFGASVTATSIVVAGAWTYVTAGAGAPAAATGVSSIATLVGGGGPGAYMSGLSTVGGWFGGNAIVGAAVLNGLSLGTVGGTTSLAKMAVFERAIVASALSGQAISGVSAFAGSGSAGPRALVNLDIPRELASTQEVKELATAQDRIQTKLESKRSDIAALRENERRGPLTEGQTVSFRRLERELKGLEAQKKELDDQIKKRARQSLKPSDAAGDRIVLAVLVHKLGDAALFRNLLKQVDRSGVGRASYLSYLDAIAAIDRGAGGEADKSLRNSIAGAPFAVEPVILLVNLLAARGYRTQLEEMEQLTEAARFDRDKYRSSFNAVSLRYGVGVLAQRNGDCRNAFKQMRAAKKEMGSIKTLVTDTPVERLIDVSTASAMFCIAEEIKRGTYLTHPEFESLLQNLSRTEREKSTDAGKEFLALACEGKPQGACRDDLAAQWKADAQQILTDGIKGSKGNERQMLCAHFAGPCS